VPDSAVKSGETAVSTSADDTKKSSQTPAESAGDKEEGTEQTVIDGATADAEEVKKETSKPVQTQESPTVAETNEVKNPFTAEEATAEGEVYQNAFDSKEGDKAVVVLPEEVLKSPAAPDESQENTEHDDQAVSELASKLEDTTTDELKDAQSSEEKDSAEANDEEDVKSNDAASNRNENTNEQNESDEQESVEAEDNKASSADVIEEAEESPLKCEVPDEVNDFDSAPAENVGGEAGEAGDEASSAVAEEEKESPSQAEPKPEEAASNETLEPESATNQSEDNADSKEDIAIYDETGER
jgi:hypothetical protein